MLALAQQTAAGSETLADFMPAFQSRVMALTQAHNLLTRKNWSGVALRDLVATIVAPEREADPARISMTGPAHELSSRQALSLTLALHELATNARKYGALSSPAGKVAITWTHDGRPDSKRVELTWIERDGPAVAPPVRKGFGSRLLTEALGRSLDASVRLEFPPSGVRCTIAFAQEHPNTSGAGPRPALGKSVPARATSMPADRGRVGDPPLRYPPRLTPAPRRCIGATGGL